MKDKLIKYTKWLTTIDSGIVMFMDNVESEEWLVDQFIDWDRNHPKVDPIIHFPDEITKEFLNDLYDDRIIGRSSSLCIKSGKGIRFHPSLKIDLSYDEIYDLLFYSIYDSNGSVWFFRRDQTFKQLNDDIKLINELTEFGARIVTESELSSIRCIQYEYLI